MGSIPGQGTKILHASCQGQKKWGGEPFDSSHNMVVFIKQNENCKKLDKIFNTPFEGIWGVTNTDDP